MSDTSTLVPLLRCRTSTFALIDLFSGRAYPLREGPNTVGRSPLNGIVLEDLSVSRHHAVVTVSESGTCEIRDTESCSGTYVGGWRQHATTQLTAGETIRLGDANLLFACVGETYPRASCFTDPALGLVVWNARDASWYFSLPLCGRSVPTVYSTARTETEWATVRARVQQIQSRETEIRARVWSQSARVLITATGATLYAEDADGVHCVNID